jgi:hypothetical protein
MEAAKYAITPVTINTAAYPRRLEFSNVSFSRRASPHAVNF